MSPAEREEFEALAAEYALGTLSGDERARLEARIAWDAELAVLVDAWNRRLAPLAEGIEPVPAPPTLWQRIERALAPRRAERAIAPKRATARPARSLWSSLNLWRGLTATGLAAAIALALVVALRPPASVGPSYVALLQDETATPVFLVSLDPKAGRLNARPLVHHAAGDRVHELWLIAGTEPPRSLGVLEVATVTEHVLPREIVDRVAELAVLAVSLEPPGGSPTGQPTGPVILKGLLARAGT
jgi:anti-sigma-K factor RskA